MSLKENRVERIENCYSDKYLRRHQQLRFTKASLLSIDDLAKMAAKYPDCEKLKCYISCSRLKLPTTAAYGVNLQRRLLGKVYI